jgi:glycosyltransferase involved in cell wall biosynthesis
MPNLEAVDWFLNKVFPLLIKKDPEINVVLAGKNMPERIFRLADKNLKVYGKIDDPKTFMADKHVMIVPLLSGGGMRVKIIEGMAAGKAIVSTSVGAEGINYTNGLNIMIADKAEDFCNAILQLKRDSALRESVSFKARKLIEEEYDNDVLGKRVMKFLESL